MLEQVFKLLLPMLVSGITGGGGSGAQAAPLPRRKQPGAIYTPPARQAINIQPSAPAVASPIPPPGPPAGVPAVSTVPPIPPFDQAEHDIMIADAASSEPIIGKENFGAAFSRTNMPAIITPQEFGAITPDERKAIDAVSSAPAAATPSQVAAQVVRHPYPGITVTGEGRIDSSLAKPPTRPLGTSTPDPSLDGWYRPLVSSPPTSAQATEAIVKPQSALPFNTGKTLDVAGANADRAAAAAKEYAVASKGSGGAAGADAGEGAAGDLMGTLGAVLLTNLLRKKDIPSAPDPLSNEPPPDIWTPPPRQGIGWRTA